MPESTKDWLQLGVWIVGIFGGLVAAFKAVYESRQSRKQRAEELRWRRANAAREILDAIHTHDLAQYAIRMMDWCHGSHEYEVRKGHTERIGYDQVLGALSAPAPSGEISLYVCDCFDWFFYYTDRVRHYVRIELLDDEDVAPVLAPYVDIVRRHSDVYRPFLRKHRYGLAEDFFCGVPGGLPPRTLLGRGAASSS
jgi:hypothetical protein